MLPHESHNYRALESIEHVLAETINWFEKNVRDAAPRESATKKEAASV
jgi:dipeptidyl aminopeptidase/acylaminoacyl peptidase